jgi:replicative DNA helicase
LATKELQTINAVLKNGDISVLFSHSVDDLFVAYGDVWKEIKEYHKKYHTVPAFDVIQQRFPDSIEDVEVKGDTKYYLDELKAEFIRTRVENIMLKASSLLDERNSPQILMKLQESLSRLNRFSDAARDKNIMDFTEAKTHYEELKKQADAHDGMPGLATGVDFIDSSYTSGLAGGDLVVVLGWTGRGKSLFTTYVCCNNFAKGYKPMIVSLEMSSEKLRDRVWTILGSGLFSNSELAIGDITEDSFESFKSDYEDKGDFIVVTNDGVEELTPNVIQAKIDQHRPDLLVFDYAQLATDNENSTDMVARMRNMSKEYKRLATANNIPVILISSATADSTAASDEPPTISQVAWSRQLAFDADLAFAVHKHDESDYIQVVCRKNRNGPLFSGYLNWDIDNGIIKEEFNA